MSALQVEVTARLLVLLRLCRDKGIKFNPCMAEARRKHQGEVRETALTAPLE